MFDGVDQKVIHRKSRIFLRIVLINVDQKEQRQYKMKRRLWTPTPSTLHRQEAGRDVYLVVNIGYLL